MHLLQDMLEHDREIIVFTSFAQILQQGCNWLTENSKYFWASAKNDMPDGDSCNELCLDFVEGRELAVYPFRHVYLISIRAKGSLNLVLECGTLHLFVGMQWSCRWHQTALYKDLIFTIPSVKIVCPAALYFTHQNSASVLLCQQNRAGDWHVKNLNQPTQESAVTSIPGMLELSNSEALAVSSDLGGRLRNLERVQAATCKLLSSLEPPTKGSKHVWVNSNHICCI